MAISDLLAGFGFGKRPLLTVLVDGQVVARIAAADLPCEVTPSVAVEGVASVEFVDAGGVRHVHTVPDGGGWLHLSVRVHGNFGCQADAVRNGVPGLAAGAPLGEGDVGVRFQPFFLSGATGVPDLTGQGLFARGLHYRGQVTPGNVLLSCECDSCRRSFSARSFHSGFAEAAYFYSASGGYTLVVDDREEGAPAALAEPDAEALAALEARLPAAPDGSRFSYLNPFRCPHCQAAYVNFAAHPGLRAGEYYALYLPEHPPIRMDAR